MIRNLIVSIIFLLPLAACSQQAGVQQTTVDQLSKVDIKKNDDVVILDVRTFAEVTEGKIAGSENADVLKTDEFTMAVSKMDKDKTYYVICRSGGRSSKAANMMVEMGFTNIYNVEGGMTAWQAKKLPIE